MGRIVAIVGRQREKESARGPNSRPRPRLGIYIKSHALMKLLRMHSYRRRLAINKSIY